MKSRAKRKANLMQMAEEQIEELLTWMDWIWKKETGQICDSTLWRHVKNRGEILQHMESRSDGFPIGSGMVESAAKQFKTRFVGLGMRWSRYGFQRLVIIQKQVGYWILVKYKASNIQYLMLQSYKLFLDDYLVPIRTAILSDSFDDLWLSVFHSPQSEIHLILTGAS